MSTNNSSFWGYYPTVLFQKNVILEIWPTSNMDYNSKLNPLNKNELKSHLIKLNLL